MNKIAAPLGLGLTIGTVMIAAGLTAFEAFVILASFSFAYFVIPWK